MKTSFTPPPQSIFALLAGESRGVQDIDDGTTTSGDGVGQDKIFADPTFRPPTWSSVARYTIVLCFALCAIALSDVMNVNYNAMTKDIATSKKLLTHKSLDIKEGNELEHLATADAQQSDILDADAKSLKAKGEEDIENANADQKKAQSLRNEAVRDQSEAHEKRVEASNDDRMYKVLRKNATAMMEMSENDLAAANEESTSDSFGCDIPFFRSICDLLGGATRIRAGDLAVQASQEAREALDVYESAIAARDREEEELNQAKELEQQAKRDVKDYQQLDAKAESEMNKGQKEELEATNMYADAHKLLQKSEKEKGEANSLMSKAIDEKSQAERLHNDAVTHGKKAYIYGILGCTIGATTLILFTLRLVIRHGEPFFWSIREASNSICTHHKRSMNHGFDTPQLLSMTWSLIPKERVMHFLVECLGVLASVASFSSQWEGFEDLTTRSRGSLVLLSALIAGFSQSIALSTLPALFGALRSLEVDCNSFLDRRDALKVLIVNTLGHFALSLTIYLLLSTIYVLIGWLSLGTSFIGIVDNVNPFLAWVAFLVCSLFYFRSFSYHAIAKRPSKNAGPNDDSSDKSSIVTYAGNESIFRNEEKQGKDKTNLPTENDSLLDKEWGLKIGDYDVSVVGSETSSDPIDVFFNNVTRRLSRDSVNSVSTSSEKPDTKKVLGTVIAVIINSIGVAFELLVISCMLAIVKTTIPTCYAVSFTWKLGRVINLLIWLVPLVVAILTCSFKQVLLVKARQ